MQVHRCIDGLAWRGGYPAGVGGGGADRRIMRAREVMWLD
jgi:hypothetical protein